MPAALIDRFHFAKKKKNKNVLVWGSGRPLENFSLLTTWLKHAFFWQKIITPRTYQRWNWQRNINKRFCKINKKNSKL